MSGNIAQEEVVEKKNTNSYDEVPYTSYAFYQTDPEAISAEAQMFGMPAINHQKMRVLELGCSFGGNILPWALRYPEAEFIGIDLSEVQIKEAQKQVADLGLTNMHFHHMSIMDVRERFKDQQFDYIISHGVFSWVPTEVQEEMFEILTMLTPNGVGYISYNALPGWNMIKSVRDMMLYHSSFFDNTSDKIVQSRAILNFVSEVLEKTTAPYAAMLKQECDLLRGQPNTYVWHEHLEDYNRAFYLHEIIKKAMKCGMQYLGDASPASMFVGNLPPAAAEKLQAIGDIVRTEQYMDFINNRRFRSTLLCWANDNILNRALGIKSIENLCFACFLIPDKPINEVNLEDISETLRFYTNPNNKDLHISTSDPIMKAAAYIFAENGIAFIDINTICKAVNAKLPNFKRIDIKTTVLNNLLRLILSGNVKISSAPSGFTQTLSKKPKAWKLVRYQAEHTNELGVTNLNHDRVGIALVDRFILRYLDGSRTSEELVDLVVGHVKKGDLVMSRDDKPIEDESEIREMGVSIVKNALGNYLRNGLLVA